MSRIDELIEKNVAIKKKINSLNDERKDINAEIAQINAEAAIERKLGALSDAEKEALRVKFGGSGNVVVTPRTAYMEAQSN